MSDAQAPSSPTSPSSPESCGHGDAGSGSLVCAHLFAGTATSYGHAFTGEGHAYDLVCEACAVALASGAAETATQARARVCDGCLDGVLSGASWTMSEAGVVGAPEIPTRATRLSFSHEMVRLPLELGAPLWDLVAEPGTSDSRWLAVTKQGTLFSLDLGLKRAALVAELFAAGIDPERVLSLCPSPDGTLCAVVEQDGSQGVVVDLKSGAITMMLDRGEPAAHASFPVAFTARGGRLLLCHATAWNRLALSDPHTGELVNRRPGDQAAAHHVEYVSSRLLASPGGEWVVDNGFTSEGAGLVSAVSVPAWLENPFEADDGPSKRYLCQRWKLWDGPLAWRSADVLAVQSYGPSRACLLPAVLFFDVPSGEPTGWFPGPHGDLVIEPNGQGGRAILFSLGEGDGVAVWDIETGERLLHDPGFQPLRYHAGAKQFLTTNVQANLFVVSRLIGSLDDQG